MPKKKPVKKKVSKKPKKAKAVSAKSRKAKKSVRLAKKSKPKKAAKAGVKKIKPKAKLKPVKKAAPKKPVPHHKPAASKKMLSKPAKKGGSSPMHIPSKPVIVLKNQTPPPPLVKPVSKVPVSPMKREKKVNPDPPEEVVPLKKVIKTFSSKNDLKDKKMPAHPNQYSIEYVLHASASLLFEVISSPSGLSEWFADDVNIRDGNFTFFWDGSTQVAKQIAYKQDKLVRFQWEGKPDYSFFEFRIETDDLTNDTSLIITDFAEDGDKESARLLWDNQINRLRKAIGS
jgi:uncharacterized protein YndB with AHSA1/START domain